MKPVDASILILGCTSQGRINSMVKLIESIESLKIPYKQKIITVDEQKDKLPKQWIRNYEERGWIVTLTQKSGMVNNLSNGLKLVNQDWVFYTEDDVVINSLPTKEQFGRIANLNYENRLPGIISYTYAGYQFKKITHERLKESTKNPEQFKFIDDYLFWIRDDSMNYGYQVEFPVTFFRTELMKSCLARASTDFKSRFIEAGMTAAWFKMGLNNKYYKATLLRGNNDIVTEIQNINPRDYEKMIRNRGCPLWVTQNLPTTPGNKKF